MLHIIDHTSPRWAHKKKNENGAGTYSADIVHTQAAHWQSAFRDSDLRVVISTCPLFTDVHPREIPFRQVDLAIQYLHCYPYPDPIGYVRKVFDSFPRKSPDFRMIFISAYKSYADRINSFLPSEGKVATGRKGSISAVYIPMAIHTGKLRQIRTSNEGIPKQRIIWFGNIYREKSALFRQISETVKKSGYKLDVISRGRLNSSGHTLSQIEAWDLISDYQYGIGVGRCALEMYTLGLRVLIAGAHFGGILANEEDSTIQQRTNFNGRLITHDRDIAACISSLPTSYLPHITSIEELNHAHIAGF